MDSNTSLEKYDIEKDFGELVLFSQNGSKVSAVDFTNSITKPDPKRNIYCFPILLSDTILVDTKKVPIKTSLTMTLSFRFNEKIVNRMLEATYNIGRPTIMEIRINEESIENFFEGLKTNNFNNPKIIEDISDNKNEENSIYLIIAIIVGTLIFIMMFVIAICLYKKRKNQQKQKQKEDEIEKKTEKVDIAIEENEQKQVDLKSEKPNYSKIEKSSE